MNDRVTRLAQAEATASMARQRLAMTLTAFQARLAPGRLVRDAREELAGAGGSIRRYPARLAGLVALAGLFLARRRLTKLVRQTLGKATRADDAS